MNNHEVLVDEDFSWFRRRPTIAADLTPEYIFRTVDKKVLIKIFSYLISSKGFDAEQYFHIKGVCKRFHEVVTSVECWRDIPVQLSNGRLNFCSFLWKTTKNEGTEGTCYRVKFLQTGEDCAFKRSKLFPSICNDKQQGISYYLVREIAVLKNLSHPNIVSMKWIHLRHGCLHSLFPYYQHTLGEIIKRSEEPFTNHQALRIMQQLLSGLKYCHARGILHRNLKPKHLVVEFTNDSTSLDHAIVRIADFALVRMTTVPMEPLTNEVVSLWYRAPELLLGEREYGGGVDIWSVGCIYAEMLLGHALFPGNHQIDQLCQIFSRLGTPTLIMPPSSSSTDRLEWNDATSLPHYSRSHFPKFVASAWKDIVPRINSIDEKLLQATVVCNPKFRSSAEGLLNLISAEMEFSRDCNWAAYSKRLFAKGNKSCDLPLQQARFYLHKEYHYARQLSALPRSSACSSSASKESGEKKFEKCSQRFWAIEWILSVVFYFLEKESGLVVSDDLSLRTATAAISLMDTYCTLKQWDDYWRYSPNTTRSSTPSPNAVETAGSLESHELPSNHLDTVNFGSFMTMSPTNSIHSLEQLNTFCVSPQQLSSTPFSATISPEEINRSQSSLSAEMASQEKKQFTDILSHEVNSYLTTKYLSIAMTCVRLASKIEDVHVISIRDLLRLSASSHTNGHSVNSSTSEDDSDADGHKSRKRRKLQTSVPTHNIETIELFMLEEDVIKTVDYSLFIPTVKDFLGVNLHRASSSSMNLNHGDCSQSLNNSLADHMHSYYKLPMILLTTRLTCCPSNQLSDSLYYPASLLAIILQILIESDALFHLINNNLDQSSSSPALPVVTKAKVIQMIKDKIKACYCSADIVQNEENEAFAYQGVEEYCTALGLQGDEDLYACYSHTLQSYQELLAYHQEVRVWSEDTSISCLLRYFVQGYVLRNNNEISGDDAQQDSQRVLIETRQQKLYNAIAKICKGENITFSKFYRRI